VRTTGASLAIHDLDVDMEQRETHRARLSPDIIIRQPERVGPGLGESISALERDPAVPELLVNRGRARRASADDQLEPREIGRLPPRMLLQGLKHGGDTKEDRHPGFADEVKDLIRLEPPTDDRRTADLHQRRREDVQAARVE